MFKPIKDFLTFIQKNSSNNSDDAIADDPDSIAKDNDFSTDIESPTKSNNMDQIEISELKPSVVATNINIDEDDIELQIKSSIMIKKPSPQSSPPSSTSMSTITAVSAYTPSPYSSVKPAASTPDHNQNLQLQKAHHYSPEDDDELADFKNDPLQTSNEDFCSVTSEVEESEPILQSADELHTEDEEGLTETYRDLADKGEIFVVVDNDLNSSIASSSAEDPLAIDLATLPSNSDETINPLDSSTNEDNYEDVNWFDNENKKPTIVPSLTATSVRSNLSATNNLHSNECRESVHRADNVSQIEEPTEEIERNDNSDSGLGIETSSLLLQTTLNNSITNSPSYQEAQQAQTSCEKSKSVNDVDGKLVTPIIAPNSSGCSNALRPQMQTQSLSQSQSAIVTAVKKPLRSNLKRRLSDVTAVDTRSTSLHTQDQDTYPPKKPKRTINFDAVQVYYFPRQQGFGCVPSAGGCTLGMGSQHIDTKRLTLAEHAAELRRAHRLQLQEVNPRGSSSEETDESEDDYLSEGSGSDLDADSNGFLQPVPPKQRRAILKAAGVRKIDTSEKVDCRIIRNSREVCGCTCRDFCDPETCGCSQAGIKCQVDRAMFPCGCSRDACGNTSGRVEFNPARVRTHFIHTIMRLDMENRQQQPPTLNGSGNCGYETAASIVPNNSSTSSHNGYYNMQPQSNYSSGYASPAYSTDPNTNYYQQPSLLYPNSTETTTNNIAPFHSVDSIDANVFTSAANTAPYGDLLPNYCANNTTAPAPSTATSPYHHSMPYGSTYMTYQQHHHHGTPATGYVPAPPAITATHSNPSSNDGLVPNNYSSCAVPSQPPFGTATCGSPNIIATSSDSDFISLSTPIASSSRYSQINDLLQHNRNTTAALVAVSTHSTANCVDSISNVNSVIETPSVGDNQKVCFTFEADLAMTTTLNNVTPTFVSNKATPISQSEPPPKTPIAATTPSAPAATTTTTTTI